MNLPHNYTRTLLVRASLLLGFCSLLGLSSQLLGHSSTIVNQPNGTKKALQGPRTITLEQTRPSTTEPQNTPTEPIQSPQTPSSAAIPSAAAPTPTATPDTSILNNQTSTVTCINGICDSSSTEHTSPSSTPMADSYHSCSACSQGAPTPDDFRDTPCNGVSCRE